MDEASLKRTVLSIRKFINDAFRENELILRLRKAANEVTFNRDKIPDIRKFVQQLQTDLEPYQIEASNKDKAVVASVDLGDTSSLSQVFEEIQDNANDIGILRSGWQGINRMTQGGFRRGEAWILPALQHNYKTGFSLSLFKQIAIYNTPKMDDPKKKPLLLRISTEDSLTSNVQFLYQNLWQNEHGALPNLKKVTAKEMATYVKEKLSVNGYQCKFIRVNPSDWTYKDIQNTVLALEAEGYEIHMLMVDYLAMIPTTGCEQGTAGHDLRDM